MWIYCAIVGCPFLKEGLLLGESSTFVPRFHRISPLTLVKYASPLPTNTALDGMAVVALTHTVVIAGRALPVMPNGTAQAITEMFLWLGCLLIGHGCFPLQIVPAHAVQYPVQRPKATLPSPLTGGSQCLEAGHVTSQGNRGTQAGCRRVQRLVHADTARLIAAQS